MKPNLDKKSRTTEVFTLLDRTKFQSFLKTLLLKYWITKEESTWTKESLFHTFYPQNIWFSLSKYQCWIQSLFPNIFEINCWVEYTSMLLKNGYKNVHVPLMQRSKFLCHNLCAIMQSSTCEIWK